MPTGLYVDEEGRQISTHSMLKTFRRCPKQAEFKYVHRLKPRLVGSPLKRGSWAHELIELYELGQDWEGHHAKLTHKFNEMFDEEREFYGDMPGDIEKMMHAYIWHYANDRWKVLETEFILETFFPDGSLYRGKVDALIENEFGLWLVDHKTHKTLPDLNFRLLDGQSGLYLWAALRNRIPVEGFIWNYVRWKPPTVPKLVDRNRRLSKVAIDTDFPTYTRALKQYKAEFPDTFRITAEYVEMQRYLKSHQYRHGEPQTSSFFRRNVLEKSNDMLKRIARENYHTSKRMHDYDFTEEAAVERVVDRSCIFSCSYTDICTIQLMGGNIQPLIKQNYTIGDPQDYYHDREGDTAKEEN